MKKRVLTAAAAVMLLCRFNIPQAGASLMESWYLDRGESNMKIGNYKAAIEAYEKAVEAEPENREALRGLGLAYQAQGWTDKAVEQFDRYLARYPDDSEIAFKQAEILGWSRYSYRRADALKYYRAGLAHRNDSAERVKYADLLMAEKNSKEAIVQYERVLDREPRNVAAHEGLARAYAWNGENDKALYHSRLALAYRPKAQVRGLERQMMKGREPEIGGNVRFFSQPGSGDFTYNGFVTTAQGHLDLGPFVTAGLEAGVGEFWHSGDHAGGGLVIGRGQLRMSRAQRVELEFGFYGLRSDGENNSLRLDYDYETDGFYVRPAFRRDLKYDSFLSLAGAAVAGQFIGAARSNLFSSEIGWRPAWGELSVKPFIGWVSAATGPRNAELGVEARAERNLIQHDIFKLSAIYLAQIVHYDKDFSGFYPSPVEPFPGGYYSPKAFVNQTPQLAAAWQSSERRDWTLQAGPSVQYANERTRHGVWRLGGEAGLSHTYRLRPNLAWTSSADFTRISQVYNRYSLETSLVYRFD